MSRSADRLRSPGEGSRQARPTTPGDHHAKYLLLKHYRGGEPMSRSRAYALSRTTAGRMGAATYLVPPLAILIGWALLAESPETLAFLGGALCLGGVVITRR
jgi:hypothetical protein